MTKRTYILEDELLKKFEQLVPQGKRGAWINEAIAQRLEEERKAELRRRMDEFFDDEESLELYAQIDAECAPAADEVWAQLPEENWPEPTIVFPDGYAAYLAEAEAEEGHGN